MIRLKLCNSTLLPHEEYLPRKYFEWAAQKNQKNMDIIIVIALQKATPIFNFLMAHLFPSPTIAKVQNILHVWCMNKIKAIF